MIVASSSVLRTAAGALLLAALCAVPDPALAQVRAALTRDMDSVARGTRHIETDSFNFSSGSFSSTVTITPAIPAGKRWLVQSVFVHTLLTDNQGVMEARVTLGPGILARYWVPQTPQAGATQRHFTGSAELNILLNAGETLSLFMFRNDNLGVPSLNFGNVTVSGYLVDINP